MYQLMIPITPGNSNGGGNDKCGFDDGSDDDNGNGAFGPNPQNGDRKEVTIYYRLNDCSTNALQKITIELIYYAKQSDIPAELIKEARDRRNAFMQARIIVVKGKPRPPQIFVTRYY